MTTADRPLALLPAVDVAGGRAAQVVGEGSTDPLEVALAWADAGAQRLHLVDLDQAFGRGGDAALMAELVTSLPVPVQLSGGLTDEESVDRALSTGADRVVLASSVLADPTLLTRLVRRHGERVVPAVDVRDGQVVSRGTALVLGPVADVLADNPVLAEVPRVLVADASRDGTRAGTDVELFASAARLVGGPVIASGGIATLDDLRGLRALTRAGVTEVVLGAALYHGAFTLQEAMEVCR